MNDWNNGMVNTTKKKWKLMNQGDRAELIEKFQDYELIERLIKSAASGHWPTLTFLTCRREDRRVDQKEKSASPSCPITR